VKTRQRVIEARFRGQWIFGRIPKTIVKVVIPSEARNLALIFVPRSGAEQDSSLRSE
jgi:hypothetical protein